MNFSEQLPSKQWAALTFRGETIAEVWFKPEDEPLALKFRIPQSSFQLPGIGQRLTAGNLLKAVSVATDEVASCRHGVASPSDPAESDLNLTNPLPPPPPDVPHLEILIRLKPPQAVAETGTSEPTPEAVPAEWQELETLWKTILGIESTVETVRKSMEGLRSEIESLMRRTLTGDEKVHALAADVAQWNKAKSRAHYTLPKASEFIHRATWASTTPRRQKLAELFENLAKAQESLPPTDELLRELELLRKDRQVLHAQGTAVYHECKAISAEVQGALRRLQSNAATKAAMKKGGTGAKGKKF